MNRMYEYEIYREPAKQDSPERFMSEYRYRLAIIDSSLKVVAFEGYRYYEEVLERLENLKRDKYELFPDMCLSSEEQEALERWNLYGAELIQNKKGFCPGKLDAYGEIADGFALKYFEEQLGCGSVYKAISVKEFYEKFLCNGNHLRETDSGGIRNIAVLLSNGEALYRSERNQETNSFTIKTEEGSEIQYCPLCIRVEETIHDYDTDRDTAYTEDRDIAYTDRVTDKNYIIDVPELENYARAWTNRYNDDLKRHQEEQKPTQKQRGRNWIMRKIKLIAAVMCISLGVMSLGMGGCGKNVSEETRNNGEETVSGTMSTENRKTEEQETKDDSLSWSVHLDRITRNSEGDRLDIYIDMPYLYLSDDATGDVGLTKEGDTVIVDYQYDIDVDSPEEVFPAYFQQTVKIMEECTTFRHSDFVFSIDSQESVTINGYDMCYYQGTLSSMYEETTEQKCLYAAYATKMSNGGVVYWMLLDYSGEQDSLERLQDYALKMAYTLQEE